MGDNYGEMFETKVHVPWMFLDEWRTVYKHVYSSDLERQRRGYEIMLMWKARKSRIPSGIECTLECIHVHIIDQEVTQQISEGSRPMYAEHDLRLMFSAAIMRFLNHVSSVVKTSKDTLYKMADKLQIPPWLVNLRHHTAHNASLPALAVLRMGIKVALEWLHENYWKIASSVPVTKSSFSDKRVGQMLDVWQSIKMYQVNDYDFIDEVPDKKLRIFIMKLLHKGDEDTDESEAWNEDTRKLTYTADRLIFKLFRVLRADHSKSDKLIALLLECETFIPPVHYFTERGTDLTHESILGWLREFWNSFLIPFQEDLRLFPTLVHRLVALLNEETNKHRQLVIALWIKQLCVSMWKSQEIVTEASNYPRNIIHAGKKSKSNMEIHESTIKRVLKRNPKLKDGFFVPLNDARGNSCPLEDVKFAVLNPNEFTLIFLPSLMEVSSPEIPAASKKLLEQLVSIAMNTTDVDINVRARNIYTVNDLYKICGRGMPKTQFLGDSLQSKPQEDIASKYDWATCPLGILPWQRESSCVLEMPSDIKWTLSADTNTDAFGHHQKAVVEHQGIKKVNWQGIVKHRSAVRGKLKKRKVLRQKLKRAAMLHLSS